MKTNGRNVRLRLDGHRCLMPGRDPDRDVPAGTWPSMASMGQGRCLSGARCRTCSRMAWRRGRTISFGVQHNAEGLRALPFEIYKDKNGKVLVAWMTIGL